VTSVLAQATRERLPHGSRGPYHHRNVKVAFPVAPQGFLLRTFTWRHHATCTDDVGTRPLSRCLPTTTVTEQQCSAALGASPTSFTQFAIQAIDLANVANGSQSIPTMGAQRSDRSSVTKQVFAAKLGRHNSWHGTTGESCGTRGGRRASLRHASSSTPRCGALRSRGDVFRQRIDLL